MKSLNMRTSNFRRASPTDEASVRALVHEAYTPWISVIGCAPEPMTRDYRRVLEKHSVWVRIGPGQDIVGMVELVEASAHVHVANLVVSPAFQRRGLGSQLLQFAESEAQRLRLPEVRLLMNCEMQTNQRFYERRGYVHARTERMQGLDIAVMVKAVLAASGTPHS